MPLILKGGCTMVSINELTPELVEELTVLENIRMSCDLNADYFDR